MRHVFKPLRNHLRASNQTAFLSAIYHLANYLEWNIPLPPLLADANPYDQRAKYRLGFYLWTLDTLAREVLLSSSDLQGKGVLGWKDVAPALKKLIDAEGEASKFITNKNIFAELARIGYRQFHWQKRVGLDEIARYIRIYSHPGMREAIEREYGLTVEQVFLAGYAVLAAFFEHETLSPAFISSCEEVLGFDIRPVLDRYTASIAELQTAIKAEQRLDEDWAYTFNPLRARPVVHMDDGNLRCPITGLLARRFTDGLYFDAAAITDALSKYLGPAFQAYVGDAMEAASLGRYRTLPECRYGPKRTRGDTVDWIIEDETGVIFLECKVLRLGKEVRTKLAPAPEIEEQFKKLASGIAKMYVTLNDALAGGYPHWQPDERPIYPILVTMDDWLIWSHVAEDMLKVLVAERLTTRGIDPSIMARIPCKVCHISELEIAAQVIAKRGIADVLGGMYGAERLGWQLIGYLSTDFPNEVKACRGLFPQDRDRFLPLAARGRT